MPMIQSWRLLFRAVLILLLFACLILYERRTKSRNNNPITNPTQQRHKKYVEIINAWYGVNGGVTADCAEHLRQNVAQNAGRLVLDGDLLGMFGFDPVPGALKQAGIHLRYDGLELHFRVTEGEPFEFPANGKSDHVEIIYAWYGVNGGICGDGNGVVQQRLRQNVAQNGGRLVLDGDLLGMFGFDPVPGVQKQAGIHVRYHGMDLHLRATEGEPFHFPAKGENVNFEQHHNKYVEIINAYGVNGDFGEDDDGLVQERLRQNVANNGGRLVLDGDLLGMFDFDTVPGVPKQGVIHVRYNGQELHLRATEGEPLHFP
ncbi:membrane-associated protein, putative [Bodo saltans]|uniref:Membrane-associated protein, putative n=1 Tax=Bodo saltans TaxID=75058 RepID=A0A0S4IP72_BODSA|nr:membrane-associated protein, putative [Bodo saltans]|eukprot:CUF80021.1 membrane-associated protein, putative [Bodo saltans]